MAYGRAKKKKNPLKVSKGVFSKLSSTQKRTLSKLVKSTNKKFVKRKKY